MAFILQSLNRLQNLLHLIGLRLTFGALNVNSRIPLPWRLIDPMTCTCLARRPEVMVADSTHIRKANALRVSLHLLNDVVNSRHGVMVSLLILWSSANIALRCLGVAFVLGSDHDKRLRYMPVRGGVRVRTALQISTYWCRGTSRTAIPLRLERD